MRCAAAVIPLAMAGCASGQLGTDAGTAAPCETTDCFSQRDVRDFEVVDGDTVVVYVGPQRCPFVVELQAVTCELSFTPAIAFFQTAVGSAGRLTPVASNRVCTTTRGLVLYTGIMSPFIGQQEIGRASPIRRPGGLSSPGPFEESYPVDPFSRDVCRVTDIRSITDDQLVELLAEVNAPPPPIGDGRLEMPDGPAEATGETVSDEDAEGPAEGSRSDDRADSRAAE